MKVLVDKLAELAGDLDNLAPVTPCLKIRRSEFINLELHENCTWLAFTISESIPTTSRIGDANMASTPKKSNHGIQVWTWSGRVISRF